jgi:hypothetical protein
MRATPTETDRRKIVSCKVVVGDDQGNQGDASIVAVVCMSASIGDGVSLWFNFIFMTSFSFALIALIQVQEKQQT